MASNNKRKAKTTVAIILVLMGLVFTAVGGAFTYFSYDFSKYAAATTGTVVDVEVNWSSSSGSSSESPTYQPIIAFIDAAGVKQSGRTFLSSSAYNFARGAQVSILYDTRNPASLRIDSWFALWGFALIFLIIGLLIALGGVLLWRFKGRPTPEGISASETTDSPASRKSEARFSYSSKSSDESDKRPPTVRRR